MLILVTLQDSEARATAALADARAAWEAELKCARAALAAGERPRRDAWAAAKEREVKEMTIKACSPGILSLTVAAMQRGLGGCLGTWGKEMSIRACIPEILNLNSAPHVSELRGANIKAHKLAPCYILWPRSTWS